MSAREKAVQVLADWIDARELDLFKDGGGKNPTFEPDDFLPDAGKALAALNAAGLIVVRAEDVDMAYVCVKRQAETIHPEDRIHERSPDMSQMYSDMIAVADRLRTALADQSGGPEE